jgi:hypothetical protein
MESPEKVAAVNSRDANFNAHGHDVAQAYRDWNAKSVAHQDASMTQSKTPAR